MGPQQARDMGGDVGAVQPPDLGEVIRDPGAFAVIQLSGLPVIIVEEDRAGWTPSQPTTDVVDTFVGMMDKASLKTKLAGKI